VGEASNSHKLLRSKAAVVNVMVKRRDVDHVHVRVRETNANEPLMTHRNTRDDIKTGAACKRRE
jgi:hypothetical protein